MSAFLKIFAPPVLFFVTKWTNKRKEILVKEKMFPTIFNLAKIMFSKKVNCIDCITMDNEGID